ncbi:MAG: Clp protease N-terminal domain-containing protein [Anaerohalosphaeraceae bacterium]
MFEHYSEHAQSVLDRARQEAQKLRHDHIGTEHILLGLIEVKDGCAASVLSQLKVDLPHAKEQVKKLVEHGSGPVDGNYEKLPYTRHSQSVLSDAVKEARSLKHATIGSEHLLLGLLYENEGTGAAVLRNLGLKLDDVRKSVLQVLNRNSN